MRSQDDRGRTIDKPYQAIVIGGSAGSTVLIEEILSELSPDFPVPIFVVQHLHESDDGCFAEHLSRICRLRVTVACDKQPIETGYVYVAPANYHMLVERTKTVALAIDPKVNWSRPSIDVLFESAARAYGRGLIALILSGASADGAEGMKIVKELGGLVMVQSPDTAESKIMPLAAIEAAKPDYIQRPSEISRLLAELVVEQVPRRSAND